MATFSTTAGAYTLTAPPPAHSPASADFRDVELAGRHHYPPSPSGTLPPAYPTSSDLSVAPGDEKIPQYEAPQEGWTLARNLFFAGFVCPLFWIFGALFLFASLEAVPGYEEELGAPNERKLKLAMLKKAENKWSWRCLWALSGVSVFLTIVLVALHEAQVI